MYDRPIAVIGQAGEFWTEENGGVKYWIKWGRDASWSATRNLAEGSEEKGETEGVVGERDVEGEVGPDQKSTIYIQQHEAERLLCIGKSDIKKEKKLGEFTGKGSEKIIKKKKEKYGKKKGGLDLERYD